MAKRRDGGVPLGRVRMGARSGRMPGAGMALGVGVGTALGVGLGLLMDGLAPLGVGLGVALGTGLGGALESARRRGGRLG
ncbi:hypothetical protein [Streptomyces sp. NPDC046887]|uniref:hypothetical protein n=1 Tax=Streptomyces sp. NPDC046887 TaxID=3155472 RepID=UPI0033C66F64